MRIEECFSVRSVSDRVLSGLVRLLTTDPTSQAPTPLSDWTEGRIFKGIGALNAQDEMFVPPLCFVFAAEESEKTTPGQNSSMLFGFNILIFFEEPRTFVPVDEMTIISVVDWVKGYLYSHQALMEGTAVLTQKISEFKPLSYDTITFDDDTVLGVLPISVTYYSSVKTLSRNASVGTT